MHYPDATVTTVVASRFVGVPAPIDLSWESHAGGGAGVAAIRFENPSITVIGLHLGLADKFPWLYKTEIEALAQFVSEEQRRGREVIVAGDWNASARSIQHFSSFSKLGLVNAEGDVPTCPTFLPWLKPLDHIFIPETWRTAHVEAIPFGSDHLAILVDAESLIQNVA
jgi:endonuclease/exonuclease/phosphatase (EEP) superfamily protein YafD